MNPQVTGKTIDEASPEERRAYVTNFLNLGLDNTASDDQVTAAIRQAQPNNEQIWVLALPAEEAPAVEEPAVPLKPEEEAGRLAGTLGKGDPRAIIEIQVIETEDGKGGEDVFVGVNGRGWQLRRGVELDVPWRVVEALSLAEQTIVRHETKEGHEGEVIERKAARFPFIFHVKPSEAEIKDWHERTDAEFCA